MGASEATLLSKLGIKPFSYGLVILQVYDSGSLYDPKVRAFAVLCCRAVLLPYCHTAIHLYVLHVCADAV